MLINNGYAAFQGAQWASSREEGDEKVVLCVVDSTGSIQDPPIVFRKPPTISLHHMFALKKEVLDFVLVYMAKPQYT